MGLGDRWVGVRADEGLGGGGEGVRINVCV